MEFQQQTTVNNDSGTFMRTNITTQEMGNCWNLQEFVRNTLQRSVCDRWFMSLVNPCQIFSACFLLVVKLLHHVPCFLLAVRPCFAAAEEPYSGWDAVLNADQCDFQSSWLTKTSVGEAGPGCCAQLVTSLQGQRPLLRTGQGYQGPCESTESVCQGHVGVFKSHRRIKSIAHWQNITICL